MYSGTIHNLPIHMFLNCDGETQKKNPQQHGEKMQGPHRHMAGVEIQT